MADIECRELSSPDFLVTFVTFKNNYDTTHCVQQFQVIGNLLLEMVTPDLGPVDLMACSIFGGDGNFGRNPHPCHSVDQSKITELAVLS